MMQSNRLMPKAVVKSLSGCFLDIHERKRIKYETSLCKNDGTEVY